MLVSFVSADEFSLLFDAFCYYGFRVIPFWWRCFVPFCFFEISALDSPAEDAALVAIGDSRCHLDALMTFYSVELLFVAWSIAH